MWLYYFFIISLYLCTQHLYTELDINERGYFSTFRKEMIIMIDTKHFLTRTMANLCIIIY